MSPLQSQQPHPPARSGRVPQAKPHRDVVHARARVSQSYWIGLAVALTLAVPSGLAVMRRPSGGGALVRAVPVGRGPDAVAIDERTDRVFVANGDDGTVSMLDAHSGAPLRTIAVGRDPDALAVDAQTQRVFAVNGNFAGPGSVSVLDARSGRLLRTVAVGLSPVAVAVEAPAHQVVVVNAGDFERKVAGTVSVLDAWTGALVRTVPVGLAPSEIG